MWNKTEFSSAFQSVKICCPHTLIHQNLDSLKGIGPVFAMIVHDVSMFNYKFYDYDLRRN